MEDSIILQTTIDENRNLFNDHHNFLAFTSKDELSPQTSLANLMQHSLLVRGEKLLITNQENEAKTTKIKSPSKQNRKVSGSYKPNPIQSSNPIRFPLNAIALMAMLVPKLISLQISLFLRFLSIIFNFWLMLFMFLFHTIRGNIYLSPISFVYSRIKSPKSVIKTVIRFSRGFLCLFYVFSVLLGLLISAFAMSQVIVRNLAEEPIFRTEKLNFDYTKISPCALVPINGVHHNIPFNHKMQLTVSLTLPESDYNRKLGIFQVRVETLSANGKLIFGSSYPTMLRYKSQPIRIVESFIKSIPLITGLQSEVQNLKIEIGEFVEGYEPKAWFRVILEQRAEFKAAGSGVPQIYAASLSIASKLPLLKRIVWSWRRTCFVWIGFSLFMGEVMVVLLVYRPVVLPGGRSKAVVGRDRKSKLKK